MAVTTPPPPQTIAFTTGDGCALELGHHRGAGGPVLLVHGASASSNTFRIGETATLVDHLLKQGFDVWTLDWRASNRRVQPIYCANTATDFTIDAAATHDVPEAIARMRSAGVSAKIGVVGHCMGGAIVTQGIAQGALASVDVENVVVTALGLFYRAAIDNVLKAQDAVLEELLIEQHQALLHPTKRWDSEVCHVDPGDGDWDRSLQIPYGVWSQTPLRHQCPVEFCHRISYMFGMPYLPDSIPTIHDGALPSQFGYIPMQFLLHCTQNLRRGYAAPFVINGRGRSMALDETYLQREPFRDRKLTLITGDLNSLWHRDSIDTMHEWLLVGRKSDQPRAVRKLVLPGYGHQDLYWGIKAPMDVFPRIVEGLRL
jgi:cholesterol oxidase